MSTGRFFGRGLPGVDVSGLKGRLIVIEGSDGSGRSTQIGLLSDWLERTGYPTLTVGLRRSALVGQELERAKRGNTMGSITHCLFYATDFADQLENRIIPALRSGFIVLADRYIYTLMAREIARGSDPEWIRGVYGIALVPDAVFYMQVPPKVLAERTLRKNLVLDYWESGMDIRRSGDMYECFVKYQARLQQAFGSMRAAYGFQIINGNRLQRTITNELRARIGELLHGAPPARATLEPPPARAAADPDDEEEPE